MGSVVLSTVEEREAIFDDLARLHAELPTSWTWKQSDELDAATAWVYDVATLAELRERCAALDSDQAALHAEHRWRNLRRHDAWLELLLATVPGARPWPDPRDHRRDLVLPVWEQHELALDLKVTRWPGRLAPCSDRELVAWLYANQSGGSRQHHAPRLFVVADEETALYDHAAALEAAQALAQSVEAHVLAAQLPSGGSVASVLLRLGRNATPS